jgi:hypothetical protein
MASMYPDPPHLMIMVYSEEPEIGTFAALCAVAEQCGCEPTGLLQIAPRNQEFDLVADLGDAQERRTVSSPDHAKLIGGEDPALRVVKAEYSHPGFGIVIVEYLLRYDGDRHPIGVVTYAGPHGMPIELWTDDDRRISGELTQWSRSVLESATSKCDPLYGAISVEQTLQGPSRLMSGDVELPHEVYVAKRLLNRNQAATGRLRSAFTGGNEADWPNGRFYAAWSPYTDTGHGPEPANLREDRVSAGEALREMLSSDG